MIIFVSGIHGSGGKEYLKEFGNYCNEKKKKVKIYEVGKMIFDQAREMGISLSAENVLNTSPNTLKALRSAVFERILGEMHPDDVTIIDCHATFFWNRVYTKAFDWEYITRMNPDMFITIIDDSADIKKRLNQAVQWRDQNLSTKEILLWQNVEVNDTQGLAEQGRKKFYTLPARQGSDTLYRLIFHPEMKPIYASYPMTKLTDPNSRKAVEDFVKKMNEYFVVFDPGAIEISEPTKEERDVVFNHTTHRDLFWLISQSEKVIAFMPEIVFTSGVDSELKEAHETNKDVWMVFPQENYGPFTYYYNQKVFTSVDDLEDFIQERGYERKMEA